MYIFCGKLIVRLLVIFRGGLLLTVKEWLRGARLIDKEIKQLELAKRELYEKALGGAVDISKEKIQKGKENNAEKTNVSLAEYELTINNRIKDLIDYKNKTINAINKVDNTLQRTVLVAYYINCKTWEEVADELGYDIRHIHRIHGEALKKIRCH